MTSHACHAHRPQLGSELFIDEQVDEEVGQVVDVESKSKVAADWFTKSDYEYEGCVRQNENHEQTETNFHCLHVARPGIRVLSIKMKSIKFFFRLYTVLMSYTYLFPIWRLFFML